MNQYFQDTLPANRTLVYLLFGAFFIAMGVLFPIIFHALSLGPVFLPMFIPILLAGFLLPLPVAISVGILTPLTSALLTQMPPMIIIPLMTLEAVILTGGPHLFYTRWGYSVFTATLLTLLADRAALFLMIFFLSPILNLPQGMTATTVVLQGMPGVLLLLIVIPALTPLLKKALRPAGAD